jgi:hypothetical protein
MPGALARKFERQAACQGVGVWRDEVIGRVTPDKVTIWHCRVIGQTNEF